MGWASEAKCGRMVWYVTVDEDRVLLTGGQKSSCMSTTSSAGRKSGSAMTAAEPIAA